MPLDKKLDLKAMKSERIKEEREQGLLGFPVQVNGISDVTESIDKLHELIESKEDYDFDQLKTELANLKSIFEERLDLEPLTKSLDEFTTQLTSTQTSTTTQNKQDLSKLIKSIQDTIKENRPVIKELDTKNLEKAIVNVQQAVEEGNKPVDKDASNYQPYRRVVKQGNKLVFDDNFTGGGAGGGGGDVNISSIGGTSVTGSIPITASSPLAVTLSTDTDTIGNVGLDPRTSGGLTTYHLVSAATTNATVVKNSAGQLYGYYIYNSNSSARKLAFHNSASSPTAGASIFFSIVIPGSSAANVEFTNGIAFSAGIAITTVTEVADAGTTAVASGDLAINLFYR